MMKVRLIAVLLLSSALLHGKSSDRIVIRCHPHKNYYTGKDKSRTCEDCTKLMNRRGFYETSWRKVESNGIESVVYEIEFKRGR